ncbi:cation:proton antiporter [Desulfomonile tiedjei]|uniref:Kef-type K+ transport system, membrane component n=1 Tax=Desulfomonile tiedjei (strain ATCC 49306 / DSM 6799 / DCB-1) TaxID=706587 RepID=I4C5L9_DESTA|nr:cation:proton antiporter [Desulfomonile tiedjei]AFM24860.1 Kef-type K+ transport system, membrane component [Desulfomonile tiedjei DSM 6799]
MDNTWYIATVWIGLALLASVISMRTAISVALVEICVGVIGGNFLGLDPKTEWISFLAGFGAILLTFLAGAEIEPDVLRKYGKESISIGFLSFLLPFLGAMAYALYVAKWTLEASMICGIALSTTSVAVVYAVMVETGLNKEELGKLILAACFVTDLGTVVALGILFAHYDLWLIIFAVVTTIVLIVTPWFTRWFFRVFSGHVSEPEIKLLFFLLFGLGWLATHANSEAVLPAYLLGLVVAGLFKDHKEMVRHLRTATFALLTPFYFLKAGTIVSLPAILTSIGLIIVLLVVKVSAKFIGVFPLTSAFRFSRKIGMYTTLLMSTGLTFGSISALFGYTRGIITQEQYTVLVTVVIGSAVIPTLIAQWFFEPEHHEVNGDWQK